MQRTSLASIYRRAGRDLRVVLRGDTSVPSQLAHRPGVFQVCDAVWPRKPGDRCTAVSRKGTVTILVFPQTIEVDGVAWHVRNVRHRMVGVDATKGSAINGNVEEHANDDVPCPAPPIYTGASAAGHRGPGDNTT